MSKVAYTNLALENSIGNNTLEPGQMDAGGFGLVAGRSKGMAERKDGDWIALARATGIIRSMPALRDETNIPKRALIRLAGADAFHLLRSPSIAGESAMGPLKGLGGRTSASAYCGIVAKVLRKESFQLPTSLRGVLRKL